MIISVEEWGWKTALLGMSLSFYDKAKHGEVFKWFNEEKFERARARAKILAHFNGDSGENKFLESICVQIIVELPRCTWQELDTYRVGITKNSASTMHVLQKREQTASDFSPHTDQRQIDVLNEYIRNKASIEKIKENLPEGYLQVRQITTNYKTIKNMYWQRYKHRYESTRNFVNELLEKLEHPYYIIKDNK